MKTLLAIALSIIAGQYFWLSDTWPAYGISLNIQLVIAWALAFYFIPYTRLMEKTAAFIFALSYVWDVAASFLPISDYAIAINAVVVISWLAYAWFRSYDFKSVIPDVDYVYRVAHKPDTFQDFLLSLWNHPVGGSGVWIRGKMYAYHKGSLCEFDRVTEKSVFLETGIKASEGMEAHLKSRVGEKWTLAKNCLTLSRSLRHVR